MNQQNLTPDQQAELLARVRNEVQQQNLQDLINKVQEKCFAKCITKPSTKLSSSEQKCLAMCMDRYVDTMGVVGKAMNERSEG